LTGLLPQPWLPLKKGETLVNSHNMNRTGRKSDQAVVLSLRKRYSVVRRGGRTSRTGNAAPQRGVPIQDGARDSEELSGDMINNPWEESAGPSNPSQPRHTINHRLSYDFGSGVIVLPDDGIWLEDVDSDSDVDDEIGELSPGGQASPELAAPEDGQGAGGPDGQVVSGSSKTRYGTYFHHPERRWQSVPGAFPTSS
jgi:calcium permeable stress-gated cation channel